MTKIYLELLDKNRVEVFKKLSFLKKKATLAGGTALCLQLKHRLSFDFDLFQEKSVTRRDLANLRKVFNISKVLYQTGDQLTVLTDKKVRITLVYYWFKPLFSRIDGKYLYLYNYRDIAADKAVTIGRRNAWRDYYDLFYLMKKKILSLEEIIKLGKKKFGVEFAEHLFLPQLTYFEDLGEFKIAFLKEKFSEQEIKKFLIKEVERYTKKALRS